MGTTNWLETESDDPEHALREDQAIIVVNYTEQTVDETTGTAVATATTRTTIVCSCGLDRCYAIGVFGLPRPLYRAEIEHLPGQSIKDRTAVQIKAGLS